MQVIFIHHSCFLVEVDDLVLIFDYFGGDRVNGFHIIFYPRISASVRIFCKSMELTRGCGKK